MQPLFSCQSQGAEQRPSGAPSVAARTTPSVHPRASRWPTARVAERAQKKLCHQTFSASKAFGWVPVIHLPHLFKGSLPCSAGPAAQTGQWTDAPELALKAPSVPRQPHSRVPRKLLHPFTSRNARRVATARLTRLPRCWMQDQPKHTILKHIFALSQTFIKFYFKRFAFDLPGGRSRVALGADGLCLRRTALRRPPGAALSKFVR